MAFSTTLAKIPEYCEIKTGISRQREPYQPHLNDEDNFVRNPFFFPSIY